MLYLMALKKHSSTQEQTERLRMRKMREKEEKRMEADKRAER